MVAVVGGICAAVVPGLIGELLTFVLISLGLGAAVLLVFYEVGLSEDKQRAAEQQGRREDPAKSAEPHPRPRLAPGRPRRLRD